MVNIKQKKWNFSLIFETQSLYFKWNQSHPYFAQQCRSLFHFRDFQSMQSETLN